MASPFTSFVHVAGGHMDKVVLVVLVGLKFREHCVAEGHFTLQADLMDTLH